MDRFIENILHDKEFLKTFQKKEEQLQLPLGILVGTTPGTKKKKTLITKSLNNERRKTEC